MKIFRQKQLIAVAVIFVASIAVSNLFFDNIPNGVPHKVQTESCSAFTKLSSPKTSGCVLSSVTVQDYGWPFVASSRSENKKVEYRNNQRVYVGTDLVNGSKNTILLFIIGVLGYIVIKRYGKGQLDFGRTSDGPRIASSNMLDEGGLTLMNQGLMAGYQYQFLTNSSGRIMVNVTLPKSTSIHMIALGSESKSSLPIAASIEDRFLHKVVLEGNFPEYFSIFCTPGKEIELLQILDPATMARLVDFCKAYELEIYHDTLYVTQAAGAIDKHDTTTMVSDVETLLTKSGRTLASI